MTHSLFHFVTDPVLGTAQDVSIYGNSSCLIHYFQHPVVAVYIFVACYFPIGVFHSVPCLRLQYIKLAAQLCRTQFINAASNGFCCKEINPSFTQIFSIFSTTIVCINLIPGIITIGVIESIDIGALTLFVNIIWYWYWSGLWNSSDIGIKFFYRVRGLVDIFWNSAF